MYIIIYYAAYSILYIMYMYTYKIYNIPNIVYTMYIYYVWHKHILYTYNVCIHIHMHVTKIDEKKVMN